MFHGLTVSEVDDPLLALRRYDCERACQEFTLDLYVTQCLANLDVFISVCQLFQFVRGRTTEQKRILTQNELVLFEIVAFCLE